MSKGAKICIRTERRRAATTSAARGCASCGRRCPGAYPSALAERLQIEGLDLDKNAVQRIESGERFVTDIELKVLSRVLGVSADELLNAKDTQNIS